MLPVGTRISIPIPGFSDGSAGPTHEVTGDQDGYLLICPIARLGDIKPGQFWVPVTRIHEHRVRVHDPAPLAG